MELALLCHITDDEGNPETVGSAPTKAVLVIAEDDATKGSNLSWRITVEPAGNGQVLITLPATGRCNAQGAICMRDGRKLSNSLELTVSGPSG